MNGRRAIVGLCMLCALLVSAFAAQSASAVGTTAFTCTKDAPTKDRFGEHCLTSGTPLEYGHKEIAQDTTTELSGTNAKTLNNTTESSSGILKVTVGGIPLELKAATVTGSGWMENKKNGAGEHYAHGKGTITFSGVTVVNPPERGCKVTTDNEPAPGTMGEEGVVHTRELTATTEGKGDFLTFRAADEGNFANFFVTCEKKLEAVEGTWSCSGSVLGVPNGATTEFTHTKTTEAPNTLKCRGSKAGIEGKLTLSGRAKGDTGAYTPLAVTTK
ncbi:MAG TPA: hypothetical protein VF077_06060 [Nitrospiraceae bacterium]